MLTKEQEKEINISWCIVHMTPPRNLEPFLLGKGLSSREQLLIWRGAELQWRSPRCSPRVWTEGRSGGAGTAAHQAALPPSPAAEGFSALLV